MTKRSGFNAALQAKCPRCRQGDMFKNSAFNPVRFTAMHEYCSCCKLRYEVEPHFFIGAMFVSYGISMAVVLTGFFATYLLLNNPEVWVYITIIVIMILLTMPMNFRYSRVFMLYWFGGISYDETKAAACQ